MKMSFGNGIGEKHLMGSSYFFGCYENFKPKDFDYLCFVDEPILFKNVLNMKGKDGSDTFLWRRMTPDDFVLQLLGSDTPMQAGKFLVKEICDDIGFTIEHLKKIGKCFQNIDEKHLYEKVIYDSYMENNGLFLTDEQREKAYEVYKSHKTSV